MAAGFIEPDKPTLIEQGVLVAVKYGHRITPGPVYGAVLEQLIQRGWVAREGDTPRLTDEGLAAWDMR